jgi:hypothetical protein
VERDAQLLFGPALCLLAIRPSEFGKLLRAEPFFADLLAGDPQSCSPQNRAELLHRTGAVGNLQLQIVEMTGAPGDVWLMDLRVLHAGAPNACERPRMMLTFRYERSDLLREVADAFGGIEEHFDDGILLALKVQVPSSRAGVRTSSLLGLSRFVPISMKRRGVETRIILGAGRDPSRKVDLALLKLVSRARVWFEELASGRVRSFAEIARREGTTRRYIERLSRLAFVAPVVVEAICQGHQPADLNAETLLKRIDLPLEWAAQLTSLGTS